MNRFVNITLIGNRFRIMRTSCEVQVLRQGLPITLVSGKAKPPHFMMRQIIWRGAMLPIQVTHKNWTGWSKPISLHGSIQERHKVQHGQTQRAQRPAKQRRPRIQVVHLQLRAIKLLLGIRFGISPIDLAQPLMRWWHRMDYPVRQSSSDKSWSYKYIKNLRMGCYNCS